jgi:hypothetical protein
MLFEGLKTEYPSEGTIFYYTCFKDKEEYETYIELIDKIKMTIAGFNDEHTDGKILSIQYKAKPQNNWLPLVKEMFGKFCEDMITHDVRWEYNNVLKSLLKMPRHKWTKKLKQTTREDVARSKEEYRCHPPEQADIN